MQPLALAIKGCQGTSGLFVIEADDLGHAASDEIGKRDNPCRAMPCSHHDACLEERYSRDKSATGVQHRRREADPLRLILQDCDQLRAVDDDQRGTPCSS